MEYKELQRLDHLANLMDNQFLIPGTDIRLGLDPIIGLVPGIGDTISLAISGYIIHRARKHGVHSHLLGRMVGNVMIDWLIGSVPFFGDMFDVGWKANRRNVDILKEHFKTRVYETDSQGRVLFI